MSPNSINELLKVTMFQTLRIKFGISSSSSTHFISQCLFSILCQNPWLMFVLPRWAVHWKQKPLRLLFRVELLAVILPVRKNPDPWGSERHVAAVNRKGIGEASEKTQQYIKILYSKVHPGVSLKFQPTPSHTFLRTGVTPGTLVNQQGRVKGYTELKSSRKLKK